MPCFLFTYHAHGTWLPNRKQGYVKRGQGILPPDERMYGLYVRSMKEPIVQLADEHQRWAIDILLKSKPLQKFELYSVATDTTHIHVLLGWRDAREPSKLKSQIKSSLSRRFNEAFERRDWFVDGGSRKQVRDRKHFDYLMTKYLPKHTGWKWNRSKGFYL